MKLEIPLETQEADFDVVVVVQPVSESAHVHADPQLSWEETYRQMVAEGEDWTDWHGLQDEHDL